MADQLYENWWMNLTEQDCGIYFRGQWYSSENDLNSHGFYIVYNRTLYLGSSHSEYKYQNIYYLMGTDDYKTYSQVHALGYSEYESYTYHFINTSTLEYRVGYYNSTDGYYIDGVWYETLQELNSAGYQVGERHIYIYKSSELKKFDAIVRVKNNITQYFINDETVNYWFVEQEMESLDIQFLPSVEVNWNLGRSFSNNVGHGGHASYSSNFDQLLRNGESIYLETMDSIFGYQGARQEYDCSGAYVGNYKTDAVGEKLWLECYNGSSSTARQNLIASFYTNDTSRSIYTTSYMYYQRVAICFGRDTEIVKIYDSCNLAYSAFMVRYNNQNYYYPCDGMARKWIQESDLSNQGFYLSERVGVFKLNTRAYINNTEIPQGYDLVAIKSSSGYTYPDYVSTSNGDTVAYNGKNIYSKTISEYMLQLQSSSYIYPRLYLLQGTSTSGRGNLSGSIYTASYNNNSSWSSFTEKKVNATDQNIGSHFIILRGNSNNNISYANSGYPAFFTLYPNYNSNNTDPNTFNLPTSLYRKNGNFIEWLGDIDDTHTPSLAYYYYNQYLTVYLYAENEEDRVKIVDLMDIVNRTTRKIEYWPHRGYLYNSQFYTEQQLFNIGYHPVNHTRRVVAYYETDGQSSILARYNVTSNTTSFTTSSYRHPVTVNGEPLLYDGSCDIIVDENSTGIVTRLNEMPSSTTSSLDSAIGLYSIFTSSTNPRDNLNNNVIGQQLVFMISSNYNTDIYYHAPFPITLLIDPFKLPTFVSIDTLVLSNSLRTKSYYDAQKGTYLIMGKGTYSSESSLRSAGYLLYDSVLSVQKNNTHSVYSAYHYPTYGYYIDGSFYATESDYQAAGYREVNVNFVVNLNNQWIEADSSTDASIISQAGSGYYVVKSNSNYHVANSSSTMYIDILTNDSITFKCMTKSENYYDYPTVRIDSNEIFNGKGVSSFTSFTVSNSAGKRMTVTYSKDSSVDTEPDRAFLAIPEYT